MIPIVLVCVYIYIYILVSTRAYSCTVLGGTEYRGIRVQGKRDVMANGDFESDLEEWVRLKCGN